MVFVDEYGWSSFFQLAARLRREGLRVVRVTVRPASRVGSALCWDRTVVLPDATALSRLDDVLEGENVVDLHSVESLVPFLPPTFDGWMPAERAAMCRDRVRLVDRLVAAAELGRAGVLVPDVLPVASTGPDDAVRRLGLPLVVKPVVGSGGEEIRILRTEDELDQATGRLAEPSRYFYERFVSGRSLQLGAVTSEQGIKALVTYSSVSTTTELGPSKRISCLDDPGLGVLAEQVAKGLGLLGMFNLGVIRDDEGRNWVHDVNLRAWGSCGAFQANGYDFIGPYAAWLTGRTETVTPSVPTTAGELAVFPGAWDDVSRGGPRALAPIRLARWAWPYLRAFGPAYIAYELSVRARSWLQRHRAARPPGAAGAATTPT